MQSENDPRTCLSAAPHETVASKGSIQERFPGSAARRNCQECRDDLACMSNPKCKVRMTADAPTPAPTFEALLQDYADWIGANAGLKSPDIVAERKARAALLAHVAEKDALVASLRSLVRVQEEAIAKRDHDKEVLSAVITAAAEAHEAASQNACIVPDGIVGDESGTPYCTMKSRAEKAESALAEANKRIAEFEVFRDQHVDMMVNRFLCWKLPQDFGPDGGIKFAPPSHPNHPWPVGTNLFSAVQAKAMILHMLDVPPDGQITALRREFDAYVEQAEARDEFNTKALSTARGKALDEAAEKVNDFAKFEANSCASGVSAAYRARSIILALKKETPDAG